MSLEETTVPALSYWTRQELDAAIQARTLFLIPSGMGGSFFARLWAVSADDEHGEFTIDHEQAGDFHGKTVKVRLVDVTRVVGEAPELVGARRRERVAKIARQNDEFRAGLTSFTNPTPGVVVTTPGVQGRGKAFMITAIDAIRAFDDFTPSSDPYGERESGVIEVQGQRVFFKIDLYDRALQGGSPDPLDLTQTTRVMTVMLPEEY